MREAPQKMSEFVQENTAPLAGMLSRPSMPIAAYNILFGLLAAAAAYQVIIAVATPNEHTEELGTITSNLESLLKKMPRYFASGCFLICVFLCRVIVAIKRVTLSR